MAEASNILSIDKQVAQLIALEREPVTKAKLRRSDVENKRAVFSDLSGKLSKLRSSAQGLSDLVSSAFKTKKSTSSDEDILTATAGSSSTSSKHSITVSTLAQAHALTSLGFVSPDTTALAAGTYEFDVTVGEASVTPVTKTISVTVGASDTNGTVLQNIASAINSADLEVGASVITTDDTTSTKKLVITSNSTGGDNEITDITFVSGASDIVSAFQIGRTGSNDDVGGTTSQAALNASFTLDGNTITSSSNVNSTALEGVTLNLLSTSATAVNLDISVDSDDVKEKVTSFLDDYNEIIKFIKDKTGVDPTTHERSILAGDSVISGLSSKLRNIVTTKVSGHTTSGNPSYLYEIGITAANDGSLSITDATKFTEALESDPNKVSDIFFDPDFDDETATFVAGVATSGGMANKIDELLERFVISGGILSESSKILNDQITNINRQIDNLEERLLSRENVLRNQFTALFEVLSILSAQQQTINSFNS